MSVRPTVPHVDIEVRYATPDDADGIAALYDRVYNGGYPLTECTDPALVRRIVTDQEHIWMLALDRGTVVGSSVARRDPGNASYELCRAAVDPDYRGRANYSAVFGRTLRDAVERPDCEVIYGYARSERARRMFSRARPTWAWTGTDGGLHPVGDEREEHLLGMAFNPERVVTRIVPPRPILVPGSAVAREIGVLTSATRTGEQIPQRLGLDDRMESIYRSFPAEFR
ncbi:GNAT family N-acetyltransferase [Micromonospora sp. H33]|uniref:GNAT family N-acetyltransferase n=1 Tax=Micromonospora sp. H33 TaxID=3452215 RepID=UPI003F8A6296